MPTDTETTATTMQVRSACTADLADIAQVWRAGWLDGHLEHVPDALLDVRGSDYFTRQSTAWIDSTLVAAEPNGTVVGVAITAADELVQLAVDPRARRRGAGAALLHAAQARIAEHHDTAWLAVVPGNTRARAFYRRHGWTDEGPMTHAAPTSADTPDETVPVLVHRYTRSLTSSRNRR